MSKIRFLGLPLVIYHLKKNYIKFILYFLLYCISYYIYVFVKLQQYWNQWMLVRCLKENKPVISFDKLNKSDGGWNIFFVVHDIWWKNVTCHCIFRTDLYKQWLFNSRTMEKGNVYVFREPIAKLFSNNNLFCCLEPNAKDKAKTGEKTKKQKETDLRLPSLFTKTQLGVWQWRFI